MANLSASDLDTTKIIDNLQAFNIQIEKCPDIIVDAVLDLINNAFNEAAYTKKELVTICTFIVMHYLALANKDISRTSTSDNVVQFDMSYKKDTMEGFFSSTSYGKFALNLCKFNELLKLNYKTEENKFSITFTGL